jgi:phosphogluconate dehydratase
MVGLNATGGSTNLTLHLIAMARAAGILITWQDMFELSEATPLLARVYPNGLADVNHFHAAGGLAFMIGELLEAGLLHADTRTVAGTGLEMYTREPKLDENGAIRWEDGPGESHDRNVLRPISDPFQPEGGLKFLTGNLGAAVIKISAVKPEHRLIEGPARIFHTQNAVVEAFKAGELDRDFICVVRFQGPKACGMPELHSLTPQLSVLLDKGFKVALVTDGRMSGASGRVPAAIHLSPEAADGGPIARLRDGDRIRLDTQAGTLEVLEAGFAERAPVSADLTDVHYGTGRELFTAFRHMVTRAEDGATVFIGE